jgi:hypothetical protein
MLRSIGRKFAGPAYLIVSREGIGSSVLRVAMTVRRVDFRRTGTRGVLVFGRLWCLCCFRGLRMFGSLLCLRRLGWFGRVTVMGLARGVVVSYGRLTRPHRRREGNRKSEQEKSEGSFHVRSPVAEFPEEGLNHRSSLICRRRKEEGIRCGAKCETSQCASLRNAIRTCE